MQVKNEFKNSLFIVQKKYLWYKSTHFRGLWILELGKEGSRMEGTLDVECFNLGGSF